MSSTEGVCFIEKILVANADEQGLETSPARTLESEIGQAAVDEGNGITKLVDCERCDSSFKIYNDGVVFLRRTNAECPDNVQTLQRSTNHIKIDLSKFLEPILW